MASYNEAADTIINGVEAGGLSGATAGLIADVINGIGTNVVTEQVTAENSVVTAGTQFVNVANGVDLNNETLANVMNSVQAIVMDAEAGKATLSFAANAAAKALILSNDDGHTVTFATTDDVAVSTGSGAGTQVTTNAGNDAITFTGGTEANSNASATINTGEGDDNVTLQGHGTAVVNSGAGDGTFVMEGDGVVATINAGDGFDTLFSNVLPNGVLAGRTGHTFEINADGSFTMHSHGDVTMNDVNLVLYQAPTAAVNAFTQTTVLASNEYESLVAKLYNVALGRESGVMDGQDGKAVVDNNYANGIEFWTDYINDNMANLNTRDDLAHFVYSFLNTSEFHDRFDGMTNAEYVQAVFDNIGLNPYDTITDPNGTVHNMQAYVDQLNAYDAANTDANLQYVGRYDVAWEIANSKTTVDLIGIHGNHYVIDSNFTNDGDASN